MKTLLLLPAALVLLFSCNPAKQCVEKIDPACACPMNYDPVCGCNGKTYPNACAAECANIKKYTKGPCADAQTNLKLEGPVWKLVAFVEGQNTTDVPQTLSKPITASFSKGKISGHGGCNSYGGNYVTALDSITVSGVFSTEMYCEGTSDWESRYFNCLRKTEIHRIIGNKLYIHCLTRESDLVTLVFEAP